MLKGHIYVNQNDYLSLNIFFFFLDQPLITVIKYKKTDTVSNVRSASVWVRQEKFFTSSFGIKVSSTYQHGPPQTTAWSYTGRQCLPLFWLLFTQLLPNYRKGLHVRFLQQTHWPHSTRGQREQRHVSTVAPEGQNSSTFLLLGSDLQGHNL